jgi:hypothetical protein
LRVLLGSGVPLPFDVVDGEGLDVEVASSSVEAMVWRGVLREAVASLERVDVSALGEVEGVGEGEGLGVETSTAVGAAAPIVGGRPTAWVERSGPNPPPRPVAVRSPAAAPVTTIGRRRLGALCLPIEPP